MAKKATKAVLLQEWSQPDKTWKRIRPIGQSQETPLPVYLAGDRNQLYRPGTSGCLEVWQDFAGLSVPNGHISFVQSGGHILAQALEIRSNARTRGYSDPLREESTLTLLWDSEGSVPCPFFLNVNGRLTYYALYPLADGGLLAYLQGVLYEPMDKLDRLIRYDANGQELWQRKFRFAGPEFCPNGVWLTTLTRAGGPASHTWLNLDGSEGATFQSPGAFRRTIPMGAFSDGLWLLLHAPYPDSILVQMDRDGQELNRVQISNWVTGLHPARNLLVRAGGDLTLLERDSLQIQATIPNHQYDTFLGQDNQDRLWFQNRGLTACYDTGLNQISSHRLKGSAQEVPTWTALDTYVW